MTAADSASLVLPGQIRDAIVAHGAFNLPNEACGLLAFDELGCLRFVYAATNRAHSPNRFLVDPREQFKAIQHAERCGWQIAGAFHSHPNGPARPSAVDVAEARDSSWIHLIESQGDVRAWRLAGSVVEVPIEVLE